MTFDIQQMTLKVYFLFFLKKNKFTTSIDEVKSSIYYKYIKREEEKKQF